MEEKKKKYTLAEEHKQGVCRSGFVALRRRVGWAATLAATTLYPLTPTAPGLQSVTESGAIRFSTQVPLEISNKAKYLIDNGAASGALDLRVTRHTSQLCLTRRTHHIRGGSLQHGW